GHAYAAAAAWARNVCVSESGNGSEAFAQPSQIGQVPVTRGLDHDGGTGFAGDGGEAVRVALALTEVGVPVRAGAESIAGVVAVHQVDPSGDGANLVDQADELLPAGVGVAGVQAEPDQLRTVSALHRLPDPADPVQGAGHRVGATGGVLDQQRYGEVGAIDRLEPVLETDLGVILGTDVATVHDHPGRADLGGRGHLLLQQLAARDPDPVVRGRDVDHVRGVHVQRDIGLLGRGPERRRAAP